MPEPVSSNNSEIVGFDFLPQRGHYSLYFLCMVSEPRARKFDQQRQTARGGSEPITGGATTSSDALSKFELVQKALMSPFTHKKKDSTRILSERMWIMDNLDCKSLTVTLVQSLPSS